MFITLTVIHKSAAPLLLYISNVDGKEGLIMEPIYIYKKETGYVGSYKKREKEKEVDIAYSAKEAESKMKLLMKMEKYHK